MWHLGSLDDPLATYVKTYARDAEILTDHLISLANQNSRRAQEAIAQVVKELPGDDRQNYKMALPEKLLASERQIRGA